MSDEEIEKQKIDRNIARSIIKTVESGIPPEYGFEFFTAGLDVYLNTIEEEYLKTFIKDGGSAFKMVVGIYGGGKTHFLYCIREISWKYHFLASYISLSPQETPFHKLEEVYKAIVKSIIYPQTPEELLSDYDRGLEALIKKWYNDKYKEMSEKLSGEVLKQELINYASSLGSYESLSFRNAMKEAFISLIEKRDNDFVTIMQWLIGENPPRTYLKEFKVFEKIDKSNAFKMIRSLVQWIREIEHAGLIVLLDEAEVNSSLSSKQKVLLLNNLRELIDEFGHVNFKNTMWFYAVPDENFLEGKLQVYEALRQRVSTIFNTKINPAGVKIYLDKLDVKPIELMEEIGKKLAKIYEAAYSVNLNSQALNKTLKNIAEAVYSRKQELGYQRFFVQSIIPAFEKLSKTKKAVTAEEIGM